VRTYYIQAEETDWDYAPSGFDNFHGSTIADSPDASKYLLRGTGRIGSVHRKALYYEYTDATFSKRIEKPEWLGYLGPVIRCQVGDLVRVVFRNGVHAGGPEFSMHPHGVQYTVANEGALDANTKNITAAHVPPGETVTYTWTVPIRSGPAENDGNAVMWMYHSHVDEAADTYAGLMGPLIVYRRGEYDAYAKRGRDVDREFAVFFMVNNENSSPYLLDNIARFAGNTTQPDGAPGDIHLDDPDFMESNMKHAINGRMFANLRGLEMKSGERVRWFIGALGNEVDLHTAHFHGQTLEMHGQRTDVIELLPASFKTAEMAPDTPGDWLLHCHVNDHMMGGMI
ncbi:Cupredoxin, partial [Ramicandelaber brevisporus]